MKKTIVVTCDFYPSVGGVSNYWASLGRHMSSEQWIVFAPPLPPGVGERATPYRIYRGRFLSRYIYPRWLPLFFSLTRILAQEHVEMIIVGQILPVGTVVSLVSRLFRIPYIVSTHGMDITLPLRTKRKTELCKWILAQAHSVLTVSHYTSLRLQELGVSLGKIMYLYPCPSVLPDKMYQDRHGAHRERSKEKILLTVSRLVQRKGHEYVLRALAALRDTTPPLIYVIVGDGPYRDSLQSLTRTLGLNDRVVFTGLLHERAVIQWYQKCDIFIMTPYDVDGDVEGFGTVYLEANAFEKPVIASRSGGVEDAVIHEQTGLLVEPQDPAAIREAITRLTRDPEFALRLGRMVRQRVEKEFQWKVQAEKLQKLL